jgi:hypothetical protein
MKTKKWISALLATVVCGAALAADAPESWDGLIEVKPKRMDAVFLLPGADFRGYTKVMIDPTQVAFRHDWLRDINRSSRDLSRRITEEDAADILAAGRASFDDVFQAAFVEGGYPLADAPGPGVLRISTAVLNLAVNAPMPDRGAARSTTLVADAGEATLVLEVRDSQTGALLGRAVDRREARHAGGTVSRVSNVSDFRVLFKEWASIAVKGLEELKAHSPVPEDLKPKDRP